MAKWKKMGVKELKKKMDVREDFLFLDIREASERQSAKIEGSRHLPLAELETRLGELEAFRDREIVIHCHHGKRSERAAEFLAAKGFSCVKSLTGGIHEWSRTIDRSIPQY